MNRSCNNCGWAQWQEGKAAGTCGYPRIALPVLPGCSGDPVKLERALNQRGEIWPDSYRNCLTWKQDAEVSVQAVSGN